MGNEYYGAPTTPTSDYLAHYGIKGMKWGVRKARESGNVRALGRQYRKAEKKLAKLERQAASGKKYAKRAAALGLGAAAAGGIAATGTKGVAAVTKGAGRVAGGAVSGLGSLGLRASNVMRKAGIRGAGRVGQASTALYRAGVGTRRATAGASRAVDAWGKGTHDVATAAYNIGGRFGGKTGQNIGKSVGDTLNKYGRGTVSNNFLVKAGSAGLGAGLAGAAGYNAYRAATTKKAAAKAAQFRKEMNKAFAGTQYANGGAPKKRRRR